MEKRQGGLTSYAFDLMVLYFLQQKGLMPCLHEMRPMMANEKKNPHVIDDYYGRRDFYENDTAKIAENFGELEKPWDLGLLFVEFLRFFASRVHQNEVIQVITKNIITRDQTRWSRKLLQIADPFRTENVVTFTKAYQAYFFNCFLKSYLYFAVPQTTAGPLLDITLYQKLGESPRKKKGKRRKVPPTPGNEIKEEQKRENGIERRTPLRTMEEVEYTAAADALVVDDEERTKIESKIMENFLVSFFSISSWFPVFLESVC
ncbi:unnamed protein product [Strongylus vulgaris]|uniref:PAP-associated domain-containing protein n=1 Tax=Strongylus vulgaris TaxID=40348 RepID=A0A3P7J2A4_STRVU|nr:unnamed protein product [Strongylus vulgaris]